MIKCPHCKRMASPVRALGHKLYLCSDCGGRSSFDRGRLGVLSIIAAIFTSAAAFFAYDRFEFVRGTLFGVLPPVVFGFLLGLLMWFFGYLSPLSKDDNSRAEHELQ